MLQTISSSPPDRRRSTSAAPPSERSDFEAQARRALANLATVLANAGSGIDRVVKATVFVTDIGKQDIFAGLRAEHFAPPYLAESFVR
ncbi:RidA family protein [Nocardia sp. CWNU-33]|uniref:RidA family protein n=1 Tax=Nocardia sp. CWNU-33 TaxID=3392117 RepID=UPI00398EA8BA